jgi:hypothetical protein
MSISKESIKMAYKNAEAALEAEREMQEDIAGIHEHRGFVITRLHEYGLCHITTADPEEKLPRPLQGRWTDVVTAKEYIDKFLENQEKTSEAN